MNLDDRPDVLTVKQAASILQMNRKRVYELIYGKRLIALRFGRTLRIAKRKLEALLNSSSRDAR